MTPPRRGAQFALYQALLGALKMFAPVIPTSPRSSTRSTSRSARASSRSTSPTWPEPPDEWRDDEAEEAGEHRARRHRGHAQGQVDSKVSVATPLGTLACRDDAGRVGQIEPLSSELLASRTRRLEHVLWDGEGDPGDGFVETDNAAIRVAAELKETE